MDGWGDKTWATFLVPAMMIGFLVLFAFLPALSPKHFEVDTFRSTYLYIMVLITAIVPLHARGHLAGDLAGSASRGRSSLTSAVALIGGMFLFFALMGNVMGKVRKNFYIGIRVPWTLASDRVWNDTHRLAAWLMVAVGVVGFLLILLGVSPIVAIGLLIGSMLIPVVYSFVHYKALERRGAL